MRLGLGPVFGYERLTAARRWQYYALRAFGLAALLVAMGSVAYSENAFFGGRRSVSAYTQLGRSYFNAMIMVELALVMLAAPATMAGAICLDRSRGTLEHLMTTDLSDREIVLGKLGARLMPMLGLIACSLPVLALSSLLGGIDALAVVIAYAVIGVTGLLACSMSLLLSIWARRPHEVVLAVYMVWVMFMVAHPVWLGMSDARLWIEPPDWLALANPFFLAVSAYGRSRTRDLVVYLGPFAAAMIASSLMVLVAIRGLRRAVVGSRRPRRKTETAGLLARIIRLLPGPSLDGNPVLWREWHRARSPRLSLLLLLLVTATTVASAARAIEIAHIGIDQRAISDWGFQGIYAYLSTVLFAGVVLSAISPMSLSEERRRGSLDVLMATPLPTRAIIVGKWLSLYRTVPWLAIGPGLLALALASRPSPSRLWSPRPDWEDRLYACGLIVATILAHGAAIISLGLALATWLRRETRAIGVSITAFVLVAVVWPGLCLVFMEPYRQAGEYLSIGAAVSPINAVTALVSQLMYPNDWWYPKVFEVAYCTVGVAFASILILAATIATFERRMGRMPERAASRPRPRVQ